MAWKANAGLKKMYFLDSVMASCPHKLLASFVLCSHICNCDTMVNHGAAWSVHTIHRIPLVLFILVRNKLALLVCCTCAPFSSLNAELLTSTKWSENLNERWDWGQGFCWTKLKADKNRNLGLLSRLIHRLTHRLWDPGVYDLANENVKQRTSDDPFRTSQVNSFWTPFHSMASSKIPQLWRNHLDNHLR